MPIPLHYLWRIVVVGCLCCLSQNIISNDQLWFPRVREAKDNKDALLHKLFNEKGISYPPAQMFIRIFKAEKVLEVWAADAPSDRYTHIKTYPICAMSGELGPKRKQGDEQVPEGFYNIGTLNPSSAYHLSMFVNYPNASDKQLSRHSSLGGDIYIHGDCKSIGCVAITNTQIEELYWLVAQVKTRSKVPVHIFPMRLSDMKYNILCRLYRNEPELLRFWSNVKEGYDYFQQNLSPPKVQIANDGFYQFN